MKAAPESKLEFLKERIDALAVINRERGAFAALFPEEDFRWIFDFRKLFLQSQEINLIAEIFWERYEKEYPFQVGGLETAAIPFITAIVMKGQARKKPVSGFFIRKSRKKRGLENIIEGTLSGDKIILVDDLINSGSSFLRQIEVLRRRNFSVHSIFALVRFRDLSAYSFLTNRGIELQTLFTLRDFGKNLVRGEEINELLNFKQKWYFKSELPPRHTFVLPKSNPAIGKEHLYVGSDRGTFWALNKKDGTPAWRFDVGLFGKGERIFTTPVLHEKTIYFGAHNGNFYALDEAGAKKWVYQEADAVTSSAAILKKHRTIAIPLTFGLLAAQGGVASLSLETGKEAWRTTFSHPVETTPLFIAKDDLLIVGTEQGKVYGINAKSGKIMWEYHCGGALKGVFAVDSLESTIYCGSYNGYVHAIDVQTGGLQKKKYLGGHLHSALTYSTPHLFVSSMDKNLYCLDADTLAVNWVSPTNGRIFAQPVFINERILVGSNDGNLYELDAHTGKKVGMFSATERITNPVVWDQEAGVYFVTTAANETYCLSKPARAELVNEA